MDGAERQVASVLVWREREREREREMNARDAPTFPGERERYI